MSQVRVKGNSKVKNEDALTGAEALARLTSNDVKDKPKDLNLFDGQIHVFKARFEPTMTNDYLDELTRKFAGPGDDLRHEVVIVGKGVIGQDEVKEDRVKKGNAGDNDNAKGEEDHVSMGKKEQQAAHQIQQDEADKLKPIFVGMDWSVFEGGRKPRLWVQKFDALPKEAEITYMGWTSKSDKEITALGMYLVMNI
ncbi:hypothetical protein MMC26_006638 [Xylographa opegraphella]|nr:hypothetical protein [Xylographa opegraphella]